MVPSTNRTGRRSFKAEMPGSNPAGITIRRMTSAGADTGPENRGQRKRCGDRHLRPAPSAQMLELEDRPVSGTGAKKVCGFDSRSVHHIRS